MTGRQRHRRRGQRARGGLTTRDTVLVTGASSGIGRACVQTLTACGASVLGTVRREEDAEALRAIGSGRAEALLLDVRSKDAPQLAAEALAGRRLRGLVNNAGISVQGPLELLEEADWREQFEVNLFGPIALTRSLLPRLRESGGRIVNVSSAGGRVSSAFLGPYSASKFALEAVSDALRQELRPHGLHVVLVEPGSVTTPMWEKGLAAGHSRLSGLDDGELRIYGERLRAALRAAERIAAHGVAPERVARSVADALTSPTPKTRYVVGLDARVQIALRALLSDRMLDAVIARATGTHRVAAAG